MLEAVLEHANDYARSIQCGAISQYNVSRNGTYRVIRVTPLIEVINGNGDIVSAGEIDNSIDINVINSVNQFKTHKNDFDCFSDIFNS